MNQYDRYETCVNGCYSHLNSKQDYVNCMMPCIDIRYNLDVCTNNCGVTCYSGGAGITADMRSCSIHCAKCCNYSPNFTCDTPGVFAGYHKLTSNQTNIN